MLSAKGTNRCPIGRKKRSELQVTTTEQTTTTPAPKPKRRVRRGPPGVRCPSCGKLAGAEDEGRLDDYNADISSGDTDSVTVSLDATLILTTACCGSDFKSYDLTGQEVEADHECPKVTERDDAADAWEAHADDCDRGCQTSEEDQEAVAGDDCEEGQRLLTTLKELQEAVTDDGETWEVETDGEDDAAPYQRYQSTATVRIKKGGKVVGTKQMPIKSSRYQKSFRGYTTTVVAKHELCGETVDIVVEEGTIETGAGDFEPIE